MNDPLSETQIQQFIDDGYAKLENAFPVEVAQEARHILWNDLPADPHDPSTWHQPVIRLGDYSQEPFRTAATTAVLHRAFDQLVGEGNWLPRNSLGSFPIRFPSPDDLKDTGWHVDASFPDDEPDNYLTWRINIKSKGRALLMLFLFSDVGEKEAPTRIRVGSHREVAQLLEPAGEAGLSFMELAEQLDTTSQRDVVLATGTAGTVYLCHPFVIHAAQKHDGTHPRFMAQPPLILKTELDLNRPDSHYSPVELAVLKGITSD